MKIRTRARQLDALGVARTHRARVRREDTVKGIALDL